MTMTHYMELLATNQPWNLILFMAIPVILAETVAITELYILFSRDLTGRMRRVNRIAGILGGIYFSIIFVYLFTHVVIPLSGGGLWRGLFDVVAVGSYLLGVVPLAGISLMEFGLLYRNRTSEEKLRLHAVFVAVFLVVAHVAMISGMLDPTIVWSGAGPMQMHQ